MVLFNYNNPPYPWFNTTDYTVPQLILFAVAAIFWVIVYVIVIKDIFKYKFVSIPVLAICANILRASGRVSALVEMSKAGQYATNCLPSLKISTCNLAEIRFRDIGLPLLQV